MKLLLLIVAALAVGGCSTTSSQSIKSHLLKHAEQRLAASEEANAVLATENESLSGQIVEMQMQIDQMRDFIVEIQRQNDMVAQLTALQVDLTSMREEHTIEQEFLRVALTKMNAENLTLAEQLDDPKVIQKLGMIIVAALGGSSLLYGGQRLSRARRHGGGKNG